MEKEKKTIWFPAKKYGYGWGLPTSWQGWTVFVSYLLLVIIGSKYLTSFPGNTGGYLIYVAFLTLLLVFICWKKGEKPKWRWGNKK